MWLQSREARVSAPTFALTISGKHSRNSSVAPAARPLLTRARIPWANREHGLHLDLRVACR
jgi:hypothetical protein